MFYIIPNKFVLYFNSLFKNRNGNQASQNKSVKSVLFHPILVKAAPKVYSEHTCINFSLLMLILNIPVNSCSELTILTETMSTSCSSHRVLYTKPRALRLITNIKSLNKTFPCNYHHLVSKALHAIIPSLFSLPSAFIDISTSPAFHMHNCHI